MDGHFVKNGNSFPIPAKAGAKLLTVLLPPGLDYQVESKPFPDILVKDPLGVDWIYNFGLKKGNVPAQGKVSMKYELILDNPPAGKKWYYFDGTKKQPFAATDIMQSDKIPGKISARLDLGDPPVGMGS
jgi:hypothetical protein